MFTRCIIVLSNVLLIVLSSERHYAIGLLFDILGLQASKGRATESPLPWGVTVHFQNYPGDKLIANCTDTNVSKDAFMSMIKEVKPMSYVIVLHIRK